MLKKLSLASIFFILPWYSVAKENTPCVKADNEIIEKLFDQWNASLNTGDAKEVAKNYTSDSVLLPTLSDKVRLTDDERIDYFEHFLKKKPTGKIDSRKIMIGCNKAVDTGLYTFTFSDNTSVKARYTFTYVWDGLNWKISSHHSSAMPETL